MKYYIITMLIVVGLNSCYPTKKNRLKTNLITYTVYKIDSVNSYYLIYATRENNRYKIVSKKTTNVCSNKILINGKYPFKLSPTLSNRTVAGKVLLPQNTLLVNCFSYDDSTRVCLEDNMVRELYRAENIKGLCFISELITL